MKVDDFTFSLFTNNALSQAKMKEVEKALIQNNEIDISIQASILNYTVNKKLAEDILGTDIEENINPKDRYKQISDSNEENNKSFTLKNRAMKQTFTQEEIQVIKELTVKFNETYNDKISLEENLIQFYLNQRPGNLLEDALEIVKKLKNGIHSFNFNFQKALEENGFDYISELKKISSEMSIKEEYELYINFLAALHTLSISNLSEEQLSFIENFQTIRGHLVVTEDISEEMLAEVEDKISTMLKNNTFCLGSIDSLRQLISEMPNGTESIEKNIAENEKDIQEKLIASMVTYIAYENSDLESLHGQQVIPEMLAVSISAGIEEMHVMNDLNTGKTTISQAIKVLKIIGGIALFTLLAFIALIGVTTLGILTLSPAFEFTMLLLNSSVIATIGALVASLFVIWSTTGTSVKIIENIINWSSRIFDTTINVWRETAWPTIKQTLTNVWDWFTSLLQSKRVIQQEQQTESQQVMKS